MNRSLVTTDILEEKLDLEFSNNFTGLIAIVDSFSKTRRIAKVKPLGKVQTEKGKIELPTLNLPVLTYYGNGMEIIPDYKKGDLVYCAPNLLPTSNQIKGQFETDFSRKNKLENLIVVYGVRKQSIILNPQVTKEGIVICETSGNMYAQFSNSKIEFKTGMSEPQKSLLGEDTIQALKDLIDAILDITVMTPVGPSSPVSAMPSNVTRLNQIKTQLDSLLTSNFKHN